MALNFPSNPSNGDTFENYVYDATAGTWKRVVPSGTIGNLSDVTISSVADDNILRYDSGTSSWVNESLPAPEPTVINTDGDPGTKIYVGATDPSGSYSLVAGDVWIEV